MRKTVEIIAILILVLAMLCSCGKDDGSKAPSAAPAQSSEGSAQTVETPPAEPAQPEFVNAELTPVRSDWAIYWYMCGSNLESFYGCATADLEEMMAVSLPENVRVVIETGGARTWHSDFVAKEKLQRHVYGADGLNTVWEGPSADMGEASTLADFLSFCSEYYPAEHTAVIFWNHGGGSISGAMFDEVYSYNSLMLSEFREALEKSCALSSDDPPYDIIGFDACLMATVDTVNTFCDAGHYLVASEEFEPGNGWYYTPVLQALAGNPQTEPEELGYVICDAFEEGCRLADSWDESTLSLTDLSAARGVLDAYASFGDEALAESVSTEGFLAKFGRAAEATENYGGNTDEQGYANMVDVGSLAENCAELLPATWQSVQEALEDCVLYSVHGPYRSQASGLSCYYPYNGDLNDFVSFTGVGASEGFKYLYAYQLAGALSDAGREYAESIEIETIEIEEVPLLSSFSLEDYYVRVNDWGYAELVVDPELAANLRRVRAVVAILWLDEQTEMLLGADNLIDYRWEQGRFISYFNGDWALIGDTLVFLEYLGETDDYALYSIPIRLNGKAMNLHVVHDYSDWEYKILGCREGIDPDIGMADKNLVKLQPGDKVTPVYIIKRNMYDEGAYWESYYPDETSFIWEDGMELDFDFMGDGLYEVSFEMTDVAGNKVRSKQVLCSVRYDDILSQTYEDAMAGLDNAILRDR